MDLFLLNSASRQKERFVPLHPPSVSLYTCGPTVYHYAHIGNLRTYVFEDTLRRVLEINAFDVAHVMNITDVGHLTDDADRGEDKMEVGAAREGKTAWEIASFYEEAFWDDLAELNILKPTQVCRATDYIADQIALIQQLEVKGFTYPTRDGVYFDTARFPQYGTMAHLDLAGLTEGARVEKNPEKRHSTDFALWKFSPTTRQRAMEWQSPWGMGFPGWHIECSAMSMKLLGATIDIHCGGVDHMPVHHTNEIAQSEAATGQPFVRWWLHGEFLIIDGGRMGKSEGNFLTLTDVQSRSIDPLAYRYFVLTAHYRSKLNFSWDALQASQHALDRLIAMAAEWDAPNIGCAEFEERFLTAVNDDLNTPQALAILWEMVKSSYPPSAKAATLQWMDRALGLSILPRAQELRQRLAAASDDVIALLRERESARQQKNFTQADTLRDIISQLGFSIEDTDDGPVLRVNRHHLPRQK